MKRHFGTGQDSVSSLDWNYRPRSSIVCRLPEVAWGDGGYGYLPYAFFTSPSLTWDFWTMRRVS